MKKKGFTLIEMIVTMLIIGIVIVIAVPAVRNLTYNSDSKRYVQMEKVILEASKLYANSYKGELVNTSSECFNIPYETLVTEELIEEEKDIKCSGQVILRKREKVGYNYEPYLTCKNEDGKIVHEEKRPATLIGCLGFGGDFKVDYKLYTDSEYSNNYDGDWSQHVYGKYNSESPYGKEIAKYQYSKDFINWIDMTGDNQQYTNYVGTIRVRAIDADGNKSSENEHNLQTDSIGPSYELSNNEHGITERNTMLVSITDISDGINGVGVDENGASYSFDNGTTWVSEKSKEFIIASENIIQVKDKLGNVTEQPASVIKACSNGGGDATAAQILNGKTAWVNSNLVTGTMPNNGAVTKNLNAGGSYTIPAGYHNGSGKITVNSLASQTSATATAAQILTGKTAWVNGSKITGTMANNGAVTTTLNAGGSYTIPAGYHNGSGKVTVNALSSQTSATATASQILTGKTAWVNGSKITGTMANRGAWTNTPTGSGKITIPAGYHNGSGYVDTTTAYTNGYNAGTAMSDAKIYYGNGIDHPSGTTVDLGFEPKVIIMRWCFNDWYKNFHTIVWVNPNLEVTDKFYIFASGTDQATVSWKSESPSYMIVDGTKFTYTYGVVERYMNYIAIG